MKQSTFFLTVLAVVWMSLTLSACGRGELVSRRLNNTNSSNSAVTVASLPTQPGDNSQPTAIATVTSSTAAASATSSDLSNDANDVSQQIDALISDLNSTDVMSDFK